MGSLKPGATYVYERDKGTVYAREIGAAPSTRKEIGYNYDSRTNDGLPLHEHIMDAKLWGEIRREARTNLALQKALDRVIMIYRLSKDNPL
jgi:hypothetical protein